jgi:hypothetical protein
MEKGYILPLSCRIEGTDEDNIYVYIDLHSSMFFSTKQEYVVLSLSATDCARLLLLLWNQWNQLEWSRLGYEM